MESILSSLEFPLLAKKIKDAPIFQTLYGHSYDSVVLLKKYVTKNYMIIEDFCNRFQINVEQFLKNLFIAIYLHDVGKGIETFQKNIYQNKHSQETPHALYGFSFFMQLYKHNSFKAFFPEFKELEALAILGHHTQLHKDIYLDISKTSHFLLHKTKQFIEEIQSVYEKLKFDEFFDLNFIIKNELNETETRPDKILSRIGQLKRKNEKIENRAKLKSIFTYFHSILKLCDDYSSAYFDEYVENNKLTRSDAQEKFIGETLTETIAGKYVLSLEIPEAEITQTIIQQPLYEFQSELMKKYPKYVLLFAPCGRGKTEGALLWAIQMLNRYKRNKIIFAMPTQITSNAMYDRFNKIFKTNDESPVGLFHGKSYIKLRETSHDVTHEIISEKDEYHLVHEENFQGNIFFKPITVTTIDHLILSMIHGFPQADFAMGNLANSVIIFDEVHYYEKRTLEHLVSLFNLMRTLEIPHLLMSGTLPDFLVKAVGSDYERITDEAGLQYHPFKWKLHDIPMIRDLKPNQPVIQDIIKKYQSNKRVFVLCNTVRRAQRMYKNLKNELENHNDILLYHSQFTYEDRLEKEKNISDKKEKRPCILVSTQTIEISLDVSSDVMFTELAPPDALGQRAGRVHRKGRTPHENGIDFFMNIYPTQEVLESSNASPYNVKLLEITLEILEKQDGIKSTGISLGFKQIKEICDMVYSKWNYMLFSSDFDGVFNECALFGSSPRTIAFSEEEGNLFKIRDDSYRKIDVIPDCIFYNDQSKLKIENVVKIPYWLFEKDKRENGSENMKYFYRIDDPNNSDQYYIICRIPYSSEIGLDYDAFDLGEMEREPKDPII